MDGGAWREGWMEQNPGAKLLSQRLVLTRYSQFSKAVGQVEPPGKLLESSSCFSSFPVLLILYILVGVWWHFISLMTNEFDIVMCLLAIF